jgi:hypothetical protein
MLDKVLAAHEREKKKKYLEEACVEQRPHFSLVVLSTDVDSLLLLSHSSLIPAPRQGRKKKTEFC